MQETSTLANLVLMKFVLGTVMLEPVSGPVKENAIYKDILYNCVLPTS